MKDFCCQMSVKLVIDSYKFEQLLLLMDMAVNLLTGQAHAHTYTHTVNNPVNASHTAIMTLNFYHRSQFRGY